MKQQILELLEEKKYSQLKKEFVDMLVPDIAELFEEIDNPLEVVKVFKLLPKDIGAEVFSYVDSSVQEALVNAMSDKEIAWYSPLLVTVIRMAYEVANKWKI